MTLIELADITKTFTLSDKNKFTALKNINLKLPNVGLISIVGKSGCGKSTLLNIMAGLDKPTSGKYLFFKDNISDYKDKELEIFLNKRIGIIFQHYHLLEDKDVLFNISLPMLISGSSYKAARKEAITLLEGINFDKNYYHKKVKDLSGGEKQRVAILRALINSPNVLFADEPTGALDSENSLRIMEILKRASKKKLVVIVSHNKELVEKYSDRIIYMKEGQIVADEIINKNKIEGIPRTSSKMRHGEYWVEKIALGTLKKRFFRNIFSILSLSICLIATTLVLGFSLSSPKAIEKEAKKRLDYGVISISKEEKSDLEGTLISLVQESRPKEEEINKLKWTNNKILYLNNYENLLLANSTFTYEEKELEDILFRPIYNFSSSYIDHSLLTKGKIPATNSFDEILINKKAFELLEKSSKINPIGSVISFSSFYETSYYTFDSENTVIKDTFTFSKEFKVLGVVDELDFLSSPTIYYNYESYVTFLNDTLLNNLSSYFNEDYSWKRRIDEAGENDELSGYSIKGFVKNHKHNIYLSSYIKGIDDTGLKATSLALTVENSLMQLVDASSKGMSIFLIIAVLGVVLIIGILSFFSYTQDKKQSAILSSLGASRKSISSIYLFENIIVGIFSFLLSILLSLPLIKLANYIIYKFIGIANVVNYPTHVITNMKYDYPFILLFGMFLVVILSTLLPIAFSKKISISKELKDE